MVGDSRSQIDVEILRLNDEKGGDETATMIHRSAPNDAKGLPAEIAKGGTLDQATSR